MKLKQQLQEVEALKKSFESISKVKAEQQNKMYVDMEEETKSLRKQLKDLEKPHKERIERARTSETTANNKANKLYYEIIELKKAIALEEATTSNKHSNDSFVAWCHLYGIECDEASFKKLLPNGIQVIKAKKTWANYNYWIAFKNLKLVGFSLRRIGEHRGDDTIPYSFIGSEKHIKIPSVNKWGNKVTSNATYTEWSKILGVKKASKLKTMIPSKELLKNRDWYNE